MKTLINFTLLSTIVLAANLATASTFGGLNCGNNYGPKKAVAPAYPKRARIRGVEGFVIMNFSITPEGSTEDISVLDAKPKTIFIRSATRAINSLEFPPCIKNGLASRQDNVSIKYDFKLAN